MKKTLRVVAMVLSVVMLFALAACNSATQEPKEKVVITSKDDMKGMKIGVQEGTTGDILATDEIADSQVERFKKAIDAAVDLKNGKLDAVIVDDLVAANIVASNPDLEILDVTLADKEEYAMAVQKGDAETLETVNKLLKEMTEDGTIELINKAYIQKDEAAMAEIAAKEEPKGDSDFVVASNVAFEPFEYINDAGEPDGYDMQVCKEMARRLGKNLKIEDMDFGAILGAISTGKADVAAAAMTVTEERKLEVDFSDVYYEATQVVIVKK